MGQFRYGVPSIVIPTHTEREYNARMIDKMHAGTFIIRDEIKAERLYNNIIQVMKDKSYKEAVENIRVKITDQNNQLDRTVDLMRALHR